MGGTKVVEDLRTKKVLRKDMKGQNYISIISLKKLEKHYLQKTESVLEKLDIGDSDIWEREGTIEVITQQEMLAALDKMKNKWAAGPRNIPTEVVQYGSEILWEQLNEMMNKFLM